MKGQKPALVRGTRDFGPEVMLRRNYIMKHIRDTFEVFGFQPLETPSLERLDVLTGKYGDEGDQLIFKVLNSGDYLKSIEAPDLDQGYKKLTPRISEKALRYDLTVPLARFVTLNRNRIQFPFKRYQIQPVWRGDNPQRGRYREFYQCDADVIGTPSLLCEAEIVLMIHEVFNKLAIPAYEIKINHRKLLNAIASWAGEPERLDSLCVAIDKLDKIGLEKVLDELQERDFKAEAVEKIREILLISGNNLDTLQVIESDLAQTPEGQAGYEDLLEIFGYLEKYSGIAHKDLEDSLHLKLDLTLARGLSYYTGAIFEVKPIGVKMGSLSGGGRYDDLTGTFGMPDVPGIGFSFGIDRIYDVMEELALFPEHLKTSLQVMFCNFEVESRDFILPWLYRFRQAGLNCEIFPETAKIKKQMKYANAKQVPFVVLIGNEEMEKGLFKVKDMNSGQEVELSPEEALPWIQEKIKV